MGVPMWAMFPPPPPKGPNDKEGIARCNAWIHDVETLDRLMMWKVRIVAAVGVLALIVVAVMMCVLN